ncbi:MAG: hypothetical protein HYX21_00280 [Candidatus Yanofskybacteria bacterium]|nr:hypothetical protein [Candidatus Yanofskybacteria bacterium]
MYNPIKPYGNKIYEIIQKTWRTPYVFVSDGPYPIINKKFSLSEVDHTDGIGTKGIYHWQKSTWRNAVLDALAMNLNDLALARAVPYKLQNHIILPVEDIRILKIIKALVLECQKRKIAITGGENSFHNDALGMDISMTVSGFVKKDKPNRFQVGDVLIGFKSNGLHSNGFTLVRKVFGKKFRPDFVKPTKIYLDTILALDKVYDIHGLMHITGGAFTKLKKLLKGGDALINHQHKLKPQPIFYEIFKRGVGEREMYQTFNCGIGFVISVPKSQAGKIVSKTKDADMVGEVVKGNGCVQIESMFSKKLILL